MSAPTLISRQQLRVLALLVCARCVLRVVAAETRRISRAQGDTCCPSALVREGLEVCRPAACPILSLMSTNLPMNGFFATIRERKCECKSSANLRRLTEFHCKCQWLAAVRSRTIVPRGTSGLAVRMSSGTIYVLVAAAGLAALWAGRARVSCDWSEDFAQTIGCVRLTHWIRLFFSRVCHSQPTQGAF